MNGRPFRSSLFPNGDGGFYMMVNKKLQAAAGAGAGESVHVVVQRDDGPRSVALPAELTEALGRDEGANGAFARMAISHQQEYVDWIDSARRGGTRGSRAERALAQIAGGKRLK